MAEGGQHECMVMFCRDKKSHITPGHRCSCDTYGHGEFECGKEDEIQKLREFDSHRLPEHLQCDIEGCKYPWSHVRETHQCSKCGNNHNSAKCYIQEIEYFMDKYANFSGCGALKDFDYHNFFRSVYLARTDCFIHIYINDDRSLYFIKNSNGIRGLEVFTQGMGYESIDILRTMTNGFVDITVEYNNVLNGLPPHPWPSDNWGSQQTDIDEIQLSPEEVMDMILDEYQLPEETLTSYTNDILDSLNILNLDTKKCPLCRTENSTDKCYEMKGSGDKCAVCLDNNVQMFFSECSHAPVCKSCFNLLV
jgi:hypothetical protein